MDLLNWTENKIHYRKRLNGQYAELGNDNRVMWGNGYIAAMQDVLKFITKESEDDALLYNRCSDDIKST